jgi:hypothetical protein
MRRRRNTHSKAGATQARWCLFITLTFERGAGVKLARYMQIELIEQANSTGAS